MSDTKAMSAAASEYFTIDTQLLSEEKF